MRYASKTPQGVLARVGHACAAAQGRAGILPRVDRGQFVGDALAQCCYGIPDRVARGGRGVWSFFLGLLPQGLPALVGLYLLDRLCRASSMHVIISCYQIGLINCKNTAPLSAVQSAACCTLGASCRLSAELC